MKTRHDYRAVESKNIFDEYVVLDKKYSELAQLNKELSFTLDKAKKISRAQTEDKN